MGGLDLLRPLDRAPELESLEQLLLAVAVHPAGAGFRRAYLLLWDAELERLSGWRWAMETEPAGPLAAAFQRHRRDMARPEALETTERWRQCTLAPEQLDGAPAAAWARGGIALGPAGDADAPWRGARLGAVVVQRGLRPHALLVGEWDQPERMPDPQLALDGLWNLAQAGMEVIARGQESRRRAHHAAAVGELARAAVSPSNLAELLRLALRLATQSTAARGGALWLVSPERVTRLEVAVGAAGRREATGRGLQGLAESVVESGKPGVLDRPADDPRLAPELAAMLGALAIVPLVAYGRVRGALAVYDRATAHPSDPIAFDRLDLGCLAALADLTALTVDQAERFDALRAAEQQQRELRARVRRQERLAALGEQTQRLAQDARNPLASIAAFARRTHRDLGADDPHREYLEIVIREADRLEQMLGAQLEVAAAEPPSLRLGSLNAMLQEALQQSGETLVRRRVRLLKKLAPDLPALLLDAERMQRVFHNLLGHALDAVSMGGRIRVESRRVGQHVVVDVAHDGPRRPGELLEELFVPFAAGRAGTEGVGLGMAQQLVREHGGEIRLRGETEWGTVFSITLPIRGNEDRRRVGLDRRERHADRRARPRAG
jgi:signal transduction histidine kinase